VLFVFENGKAAKVPLSSYETKTNRKKLSNAYSSSSKLVKLFVIKENAEILLISSKGKALVFNTGMLLPKAARDTVGVSVMSLKKGDKVENAFEVSGEMEEQVEKYKVKNIPAAGIAAKELEDPNQLKF
jgi:DNA gyrase subunit A